MGLIRAFTGALRSELADQWKEYFICDSMPQGVLIQKGQKRINQTHYKSSNTKGSNDIITKDSVLVVNEGQAMIVTEQGKIIDFCCEAGAYTFDSNSEPSMFAGGFGQGLIDSFKKIGQRFTFGGDTGNDQRVYYVNTKEILGNKYGSAQPMAYDDPYYKTVLYIRYFGMFTFKITDPLVFYNSIAGNVTSSYNSEQLLEQCRSEFLTALDASINQLSGKGVKFSAIPSHQMELADLMNNILDTSWKQARGLEIIAVSIEKITPDDVSRKRIEDFDNAMMLGSSQSAMQGRMTAAQAAMFENMGKQGGGVGGGDMMGAALGMMGLNMMNGMMAPGGQPAPGTQTPSVQNQQAAGQAPAAPGGNSPQNSGNNASNTAPATSEWTCKCGAKNHSKFCSECGARRPLYQCDKCGWKPDDPSNPPKFCPECGDRFDENDLES